MIDNKFARRTEGTGKEREKERKGKEKKTEVVNLEDLIDVKGWKALGNRLSQDRVLNVRLTEEPEEYAPEEAEEDEEASESEGSKAGSSQGLKKKAEPEPWLDPGEQASLFAEPPKNQAPSHQPSSQRGTEGTQKSQPKPKVKAEQQSLFGEKAESGTLKAESKPDNKGDNVGKAFEVGDTIEFKL